MVTRWIGRLIACVFVLLVVFMTMSLQPIARAEAPDVPPLRVEVTDSGFAFNGMSGDVNIEVQQGQLVEIVFIWNHRGYPAEEHVIVLDGYKLETDKIDASHREATLKFIANKPGTFTFKCDLNCDIHSALQRGRLKVKAAGDSAAANLTATSLRMTPSASTTAGAVVSLMVALKDAKGAPVAKAVVHFYMDAEFAGTRGQMEIGTVKTDANGVAFLEYRPTVPATQQTITASFEGMGVFGESQSTTVLQLSEAPPSAYVIAPIGLDSMRSLAPLVVVAVILVVWLIYAWVLSQVWSISRRQAKK